MLNDRRSHCSFPNRRVQVELCSLEDSYHVHRMRACLKCCVDRQVYCGREFVLVHRYRFPFLVFVSDHSLIAFATPCFIISICLSHSAFIPFSSFPFSPAGNSLASLSSSPKN